MAQALPGQQVTPADELRELLTKSEKLVANLTGSGTAAVGLLLDLDRVAELWPRLEAAGLDLRPEAGRWETLRATVRQRAPVLVGELRASGGLPALRAKHHPAGDAAWWWNLAEEVRSRALRRGLTIAGVAMGVVAIVALLGFVLSRAFPVDPMLQQALKSLNDGQDKIQKSADYAGALSDFEAAVVLTPNDAEPWLWLGATRMQLADDAGARQAFEQGRKVLKSDLEFHLLRSTVYLGMQDINRAQADVDAALVIDPQSAEAYYYQATIYEYQARLRDAAVALQRCSELAEARQQTELSAMSRYRMGLILQQAQAQMVQPVTPTVTP